MVQKGSLKLSTQLRECRVAQGLSQRELAEISGLTDVTISRIEQSHTGPHVTIETLERLADALEVSTDTLLGRLSPSIPHPFSPELLLHHHWDESVPDPTSEIIALRVNASYYSALIADTGQIVFATNMNRALVFVNSMCAGVFCYTREELIGMSIEGLMAESSHPICRQMRAQKLLGTPTTSYQVTALTKSQDPFPLRVTTQLMYLDGRVIGIQGVGGVVGPDSPAR